MQNKALVVRMSEENSVWMEYNRYVLKTDSYMSLKGRMRNKKGRLKWCPKFQARMDTREINGIVFRDFYFWQADNRLLPLHYIAKEDY